MDANPDPWLALPTYFVTLGKLLVIYGSPFSHLYKEVVSLSQVYKELEEVS